MNMGTSRADSFSFRVPKPRFGDPKPRLGDPKPRLGDAKPRLEVPKPRLETIGPGPGEEHTPLKQEKRSSVLCEVFSPRPCSPSAHKLARFARGGVPGWAEVHRHQPPRVVPPPP